MIMSKPFDILFYLTFPAYLLYMPHTRENNEHVKNLLFKNGSLFLFFYFY